MGTELAAAAVSGSLAAVISGVSAWFASRAARNSRPVANGFAEHVKNELAYLRQRLDSHIDTCR